MIKKLMDWITGKSDAVVKSAEAPYKVEAITPMPLGTEAVMSLQAAHDQVVASGQPDDSKGLDVAIATQAAKAPRAPKAKTAAKPKAKTAAKPAARTAAKKAVAAKPRAKRAV